MNSCCENYEEFFKKTKNILNFIETYQEKILRKEIFQEQIVRKENFQEKIVRKQNFIDCFLQINKLINFNKALYQQLPNLSMSVFKQKSITDFSFKKILSLQIISPKLKTKEQIIKQLEIQELIEKSQIKELAREQLAMNESEIENSQKQKVPVNKENLKILFNELGPDFFYLIDYKKTITILSYNNQLITIKNDNFLEKNILFLELSDIKKNNEIHKKSLINDINISNYFNNILSPLFLELIKNFDQIKLSFKKMVKHVDFIKFDDNVESIKLDDKFESIKIDKQKLNEDNNIMDNIYNYIKANIDLNNFKQIINDQFENSKTILESSDIPIDINKKLPNDFFQNLKYIIDYFGFLQFFTAGSDMFISLLNFIIMKIINIQLDLNDYINSFHYNTLSKKYKLTSDLILITVDIKYLNHDLNHVIFEIIKKEPFSV